MAEKNLQFYYKKLDSYTISLVYLGMKKRGKINK
jgi:hypothetical protein